jgi:phenylpropionate dioxygenase-like ring-hydroxylating dioxygenase large terminal subunit
MTSIWRLLPFVAIERLYARAMAVFADSRVLERYWHAIATSIEATPGPLPRTLLGRPLVVWRGPDGQVVAAPDRCPHRQAPLSAGTVSDGVLVCCYHGWNFGAAGRCVRVPSAVDELPIPPAAHLDTVHVAERYGLVWVCLGDPVKGIPEIAQDADRAFRRINSPVQEWETSATRMVDNFLDIAHFPWVHTGTFGRAQETTVPTIELEPLDDSFHGYRYEVEVDNTSSTVTTGLAAKVLTRQMSTGFSLPFNVRSTIHYESGLDHVILLISTPISDTRSYFTFVVWRNDDFSVPSDEVIAFDRAIGEEDRRMLEQVGGVLPLGRTDLVSVQADKASVEWRRRFAELLGA